MKYAQIHAGEEFFVCRIEHGEDLLETLRKFVAEKSIRNAVIISAIGSAVSYRFHVVASTDYPPKEAFPQGERAVDISNMQGYVLDGRVHAHITFSDQQVSFGGHLEPGVRVLTFAVLTLAVLPAEIGIEKWDQLD